MNVNDGNDDGENGGDIEGDDDEDGMALVWNVWRFNALQMFETFLPVLAVDDVCSMMSNFILEKNRWRPRFSTIKITFRISWKCWISPILSNSGIVPSKLDLFIGQDPAEDHPAVNTSFMASPTAARCLSLGPSRQTHWPFWFIAMMNPGCSQAEPIRMIRMIIPRFVTWGSTWMIIPLSGIYHIYKWFITMVTKHLPSGMIIPPVPSRSGRALVGLARWHPGLCQAGGCPTCHLGCRAATAATGDPQAVDGYYACYMVNLSMADAW